MHREPEQMRVLMHLYRVHAHTPRTENAAARESKEKLRLLFSERWAQCGAKESNVARKRADAHDKALHLITAAGVLTLPPHPHSPARSG